MNALWIQRMSSYQNSNLAISSAKVLIEYKIYRRASLLKKFNKLPHEEKMDEAVATINQVLLFEARAAKYFWSQFKTLTPPWADFHSRKPRGKDVTNKLLDIGYHHISNIVKKILDEHGVNTSLALLHRPQRADSAPLVYDLVEMFRADLVDSEVLKYLRLKKQPIGEPEQKDISIFLHRLNKRINKKYYLREFKQCHTYKYYVELQIIKFIKAVNKQEVYSPLELPTRHDTRCTCQPPLPML